MTRATVCLTFENTHTQTRQKAIENSEWIRNEVVVDFLFNKKRFTSVLFYFLFCEIALRESKSVVQVYLLPVFCSFEPKRA